MEISVEETPPAEELHPADEEPPADKDLISSLPDAVISNILGFLPLKEAVRTSALDRAWRRLWTSIPRLDFCPPAAETSAYATPRVVDRVLRSHRGLLSACRLLLDPTDECFPRLRRWVSRLAEKRIRSLELHGLTARKRRRLLDLARAPTLPPGALGAAAETLRHISLGGFCLPDTDRLLGCGPNLTSLRLSYIIYFTDGQLSDVLACCPRLVKLSLFTCFGLERLAICSLTLRQLALSDLREPKTILVDAPALVTLTVSAMVCRKGGLDIRTPHVEALSTFSTEGDDVDNQGRELPCCWCTKDVLEHLSNVMDRPSFNVRTSPFGSLRRLAVHVNLNDLQQVLVLRFTFMTCAALQEVRIKNGKAVISNGKRHRVLPYTRKEVWQQPDCAECLKNFCETICELSLDGYRGKDMEWEFLAFLVSNAVALRRLHIRCCTECEQMQQTVTTELLATMKRASADLVVTFNEQRVDPS